MPRALIRLSVFILFAMLLTVTGCSEQQDLGQSPGEHQTPVVKAIPSGYYDTVDATNSTTLRATLHAAIDDHTKIPYTSTATDTWNVLELADQDPNDSGRILDVYLNESYPKYGEGNLDYNREHSWPKSYGFPDDLSSNYPYTDCHHLFLCNDSYNTSRSNKPYRYGSAADSEKPTEVNDGMGGGTGVYPGNSNWTSGSYTEGTWETWMGRRGDVARALLYMDVRYEGGTHGVTGHSEPDLILTDSEALILASNTGNMESVGYMGMLSVLLQWHIEDPVDAREQARNDAVYAYQGNRNPFIDHPEWVECLFNNVCDGGDTTPPAAPTGLTATAGTLSVALDWNDNGESDLAGYEVYRATAGGGPFTSVGGQVSVSSYNDSGLTAGTTYYYVVTARDNSANESLQSAEASATPIGGGTGGDPAAWINEFHYDNDSTDTGEFFEIAGTAGLSLSGWTVYGYNGNGGVVYDTEPLSGTLPDQGAGFGTLSFPMAGMQNGSPDGLALTDDQGAVVMFISYEGTISATDGPASGTSSVDIGVTEPTTTPIGYSLQLGGSGSVYADFNWQAAAANTSGAFNTGQTFVGAPTNEAPTAEAGGPYSGEKGVAVNFSSAGSTDTDGTITGYAWTFGDGGTSTLAAPTHVYAATGTFNVTLVVTDDQGATGNDSASAVISDTTAPAAPTGLGATASDGSVDLDWADNGEGDLGGYTVYRATVSGGPYTAITGLVTGSAYTDGGVSNGTTYFYVVTASDGDANASGYSAEVSATPAGGGTGDPVDVWINEFHYDNDGADKNEFVEVAGASGTDLTGWTVVAYNGADGSAYLTGSLSGALTDQMGGFGVQAVAMVGLQNGSPDGLALVDDTGQVVQFLSYEGSFTAVGGAADGLSSTDIGISEPADAPRRTSLQLAGTGTTYADFTWEGPYGKTDGDVNSNQIFSGSSGGDTTPPAVPTGLGATAGDGVVNLNWADNSDGDLDGYTVYRATSAGGPYSAVSSLLGSSDYVDNAVSNDVTYSYVVTASDLTGNESGDSAEVTATPAGGGTTVAVHVGAISVSSTVVRNKESGHAAVLVLDDQGTPVTGLTVTGTFTGSIPGAASGVTGSDGIANLTSLQTAKPGITFTFCVDGVTGSGFTYDSGANVETCDTY